MLRNPIFLCFFFSGGSGPPAPLSGSAHVFPPLRDLQENIHISKGNNKHDYTKWHEVGMCSFACINGM